MHAGCRGCGGLPLESPRPYSALDTADLHAAVCHVQRLYPAAPLLLAGFSMGAMLVTKYLSEIETGVHKLGECHPGYHAAAVSACLLCMHACTRCFVLMPVCLLGCLPEV